MSKLVMVLAAWVLATGYLIAAALRLYVATLRLSLRRWYQISALACVGLAINQVWLLASGVTVSNRIIYGQACAIVMVVSALIKPVVVVFHEAAEAPHLAQ